MSESDLQKNVKIEKVSGNASHGHEFSDFTEVNPAVYADTSSKSKKTEFYFHEGKLYKTYTIYLTQDKVSALYQQKLNEHQKKLGKPKETYTDKVFSMPIKHTVWETKNETLDLRYGAGYVYEVRTNILLAEEKQKKIDLKHAI